MSLLAVVGQALLVTAALLVVGTVVVVGRDGVDRARRHFRSRFRTALPYLLVLAGVLAVNQVARTAGPELSWFIGWNVTSLIYAIEGDAVATLQSMAVPPLTAFLSFVYLYGYAFLVTFPFVAYFAAADPRPMKVTTVAYVVNYAIGVAAYVLLIAYGPRNFMPETVESLLYTAHPQAQLLTRQVNVNTNVFPSLHSSLSVTVALLAWRTRETYPRWAVIAPVLAGCVVVATMYLGIHWATDVVAGVALAVGSVRLAERWLERTTDPAADPPATVAD